MTTVEPSPPLIEPELGPGSGRINPRADALVPQMSDHLARAQAFALEAEEVWDEVPEQSPRLQLSSVRHVALRPVIAAQSPQAFTLAAVMNEAVSGLRLAR